MCGGTGRLCARARDLVATSVRAALGGAFGAGLPIAVEQRRMRRSWRTCASCRCSTRASAIDASRCSWIAMGHADERRSGASAVALQRGCKCRENGRGGASPRAGRGPCRRPASGEMWAYDFVFDACANGQQLKCLTVIDEFTRECLAIDVAGSIRSAPRDRGARQAHQRAWSSAVPALRQRPGVPVPRAFCAGSRTRTSKRRSSIRASRGRTARTSASTASSATSA